METTNQENPTPPQWVKVTLSKTPYQEIDQSQVLNFTHRLTSVSNSTDSAGKFGIEFVSKQPEWLFTTITQQLKSEHQYKGGPANAVVQMYSADDSDYDSDNQLFVKIRDSPNASRPKKSSTPIVSIVIAAYVEMTGENPTSLNSSENVYQLIVGCKSNGTVPHLLLCPTKAWKGKGADEMQPQSKKSLTLIVEDNELVQSMKSEEVTAVVEALNQDELSKKRKRKKDPNAPKKPKTSYNYFFIEERKRLADKHPTKKSNEIVKMVSANWNDLSEDDKQEYIKKHTVDQRRYSDEMSDYVPVEDEEEGKEEKETEATPVSKKKKKKDPHAPKASHNIYWFFCDANRSNIQAENPGKSFVEVNAIVTAQYKEISAEEKAKYQEMADKDKIRYKEEMEEYAAGKKFNLDGNKKKKKPAQTDAGDEENSALKETEEKEEEVEVEEQIEKKEEEVAVEAEVASPAPTTRKSRRKNGETSSVKSKKTKKKKKRKSVGI